MSVHYSVWWTVAAAPAVHLRRGGLCHHNVQGRCRSAGGITFMHIDTPLPTPAHAQDDVPTSVISAKPVVVALIGLPGSGKSLVARALEDQLGLRRVDRDTIRHAMFPKCSYSF